MIIKNLKGEFVDLIPPRTEKITCNICEGTGEIEGICMECGGRGVVEEECFACSGDGKDKKYNHICEKCDGSGKLEEKQSSFKILEMTELIERRIIISSENKVKK